MSVSSYRFIDPQILSAIANLQLLAKTVVDGFMLGVHQSPKLGVGLEFNQYRSYQPGDDVRRIDWKTYARSDRFFVRESEVETSVSIRFVLDATASMAHEDSNLTKLDYARYLTAALAYLANAQGDAIGLTIVRNKQATSLPARRTHAHLHRVLDELETLSPAGHWPDRQQVESLFSDDQNRGLIVFVSDMHEVDDEIQKALTRLSSFRNEVLLFHLVGRNERDFTFEGAVTFEDLETSEIVEVDAEGLRPAYLQALDRHLQGLKQASHEQHISYELLLMDQPLDFALRNYLTYRLKH